MTTDMVTAHQTQSDDATKMKSLGRIGAVSAVAGAVVLLIATLVHPFESDPNIDRLAFAEYAADSLWVWSHLGQFLGVAILGVALVALAGTLTSGRARP